MSKELPKTVHVIREEDGDDSFLIAGEGMDDINLERDEYTTVGIYKLEKTREVTLVAYIKEGE